MSKHIVGVHSDDDTGRIFATIGRVLVDGDIKWKKPNHDITDAATIAVAKLGEMMGIPIELYDADGYLIYRITVARYNEDRQ